MSQEQQVPGRTPSVRRRNLLQGIGVLLGSGLFAGQVAGKVSGQSTQFSVDEQSNGDGLVCTVTQGDTEYELTPLVGTEPVEEFYDLRIPELNAADNGGTDPGEGPYFASVGTEYLQREATSVLFLYDGPNGLSLVIVHGKLYEGGESAVTMEYASLPTDLEWLVRDDYYINPNTGQRASTNYDNWDTTGATRLIDWRWAAARTDGGVLGYFDGPFSITVTPFFNEEASLYQDGFADFTGWEILTGDLESPNRISLNLDEPITITCEAPDDGGEGGDEDNGEDGGNNDDNDGGNNDDNDGGNNDDNDGGNNDDNDGGNNDDNDGGNNDDNDGGKDDGEICEV